MSQFTLTGAFPSRPLCILLPVHVPSNEQFPCLASDHVQSILGICMESSWLRRDAGFDACGHMSEETRNADVSAPWGIVVALGTSAIVGWGYLMALLYSIQVGQLCHMHVVCPVRMPHCCAYFHGAGKNWANHKGEVIDRR